MKHLKTIAFFFIICVLTCFCVSCSDRISQTQSGVEKDTGIENDNTLTKLTENDNVYSAVSADYATYPLEECIERSRYVIKAKYVGTESEPQNALLFEVRQEFKGHVSDSVISVRSIENPEQYVLGEEYYLVLCKHDNVFLKNPVYTSLPYSLFPASQMANALLYNDPLSMHASIEEANLNAESFEVWLRDIIALHPDSGEDVIGQYVSSSDIYDIISGSEFVLKIKPVKQMTVIPGDSRSWFKCEVTAQYKGNKINADIIFVFSSWEEINADEEIIVCANTLMTLSEEIVLYPVSKNNTMSPSFETMITEAIAAMGK